MNDFEKSPNSKVNDIPGGIRGFTFSLLFFLFIFAIGVAMSMILK